MSQCLKEEPVQTAPEKKRIIGIIDRGEGAGAAFLLTIAAVIAAWFLGSTTTAIVTTVAAGVGGLAGFHLLMPRTRRTLIAVAIVVPLVFGFVDLLAYTKASAERDRIETQQQEQRAATEKPWRDAEAQAKAALKDKNYWVKSVALDPNDFTQGRAMLDLYAQGRSMVATVVIIRVGDDWTVNCPAQGGVIDVTANNNQLAIALNETGRCPAGLKKSPDTP